MREQKRIVSILAVAVCTGALGLAVGFSPSVGLAASSGSASSSTASASAASSSAATSASQRTTFDQRTKYSEDVPEAVSNADNAGSDAQAVPYTSDQFIKDNTPAVKTLDDGTQIQTVPYDVDVDAYKIVDFMPSYNLNYLHADQRGCGACHEDLAKTLNEMTDFDHQDMTRCAPTQMTVQQCVDCHTWQLAYISEQYAFGDLIHMIHYTNNSEAFTAANGNCWSCHYIYSGEETGTTQESNIPGTTYALPTGTTALGSSGTDFQLWDVVKHSVMRGISEVSDLTTVDGTFDWDQDASAWTNPWDYNWRGPGYYWDHDRYHYQEEGVPLDDNLWNNWTITVSGCVNQEVTYTLPDLIAAADADGATFDGVKGLMCTMNPTGGPFWLNANIKAIPLSYLVEKAGGVTDDAYSLEVMAADGSHEDTTRDVWENNLDNIYIVYEMNGDKLQWESGYPVWCWYTATSAGNSWKSVSDFVFTTKDQANAWLPVQNGWHGQGEEWTVTENQRSNDDPFFNKPNVGFLNLKEGTVIETGQPFTVEGFAHGYDETIAAIEISLDGGKTWTTYDTPNVDHTIIVHWDFTFTPPADGAYVVRARAVDTSGHVTKEPVEVMVVAKTSDAAAASASSASASASSASAVASSVSASGSSAAVSGSSASAASASASSASAVASSASASGSTK